MSNTGVGGLGAAYTNPKALATQNQIMKDELARDSAMQAEEDKRQFISQTNAMENDIIGKKLGVDTSIMGTAFGQSNQNLSQAAQIAAQRASILPGIIGMGLQGASMFMSGGLGGLGGRGGSAVAPNATMANMQGINFSSHPMFGG